MKDDGFDHPYDMVLVLWDDPGMLGLGWTEDKDLHPKAMLARNIGWLVGKSREHYVLAASIADPATLDNGPMSHHAHFQIARSLIRHVHVIAKRGSTFPTTEKPPNADTKAQQ